MSKLLRLVPFLALMALLMLSFRAAAGTAVLLRDIADDPRANVGSAPRQLAPFKDQVAFITTPPNGPAGVWMSDGTESGTRLIHAGCPVGSCDGNPGPEILGTVGGFLVFSVPIEEQRFRNRLWRTDGTVSGTEPVTDDPDLYMDDDPAGALAVVSGDVLYFHACPDALRCGVWQSDGTPAGTIFLGLSRGRPVLAGGRLYAATQGQLFVYDTKTGAGNIISGGWEGFPYNLAAVGGRLFFMASSITRGAEVWKSDGTAAGTRPLSRFSAPSPFAETPWIKAVNGFAYFVANDTAHGFELWRSDGTVPGTRRVTDFGFVDALRGLQPQNLAVAGSRILYNARVSSTAAARLWTSDGRLKSTAPFRSLCRPGACNLPVTGSPLMQIGGKVFFPAENGLWSTDGTPPGTRRFVDHRCTGCLGQSLFQALGEKILFLDKDAAHGVEIWSSNGTPAGTRRLTGMPEGNPLTGRVVAAGGRTFFLGRDAHGEEPWVADGAGTRLLADIGRSALGSEVFSFAAVAGRAFFSACDGTERAIWSSSGIPGTTEPVAGTETPCRLSLLPPRAAGGRLYFELPDASQVLQLWSTDGGVPVQITDFASHSDSAGFHGAAALDDRLLLPMTIDAHSTLWSSDGTPQGTVMFFALPDGDGAADLRGAGNEVYFQVIGRSGYSLWRTDGTAAGTRKLASDIFPGSGVVRLGAAVLFAAFTISPNGSSSDLGLWKTDGTAAGTVRLAVFPRPLGPVPQEMVALQGKIYFFVPDGAFWSLWRSDGTAAGTVPVVQLGDPEINEQAFFGLTVFAGRLFFAARDGAHGRELWTSDGTAAGTRMVTDLIPGIDSSRPEGLIAAGGTLYFSAYDAVHGRELWQSDGTAAGTRLAQDIAPEGSSSPRNLTVAGDHLYFTADDGLTGREVWSLPLVPLVP